MVLRRRYLVALVVVAIGAVASVVAPPVIRSIKTHESRDGLVAALAVVNTLRVPSGFVPLTGCALGIRCYRVSGSPHYVIATTAQIFRETGATASGFGACGARRPPRLPWSIVTCEYFGELHGHDLNVVVGPYFKDGGLRITRDSELQVNLSCGYGSAPSQWESVYRCTD